MKFEVKVTLLLHETVLKKAEKIQILHRKHRYMASASILTGNSIDFVALSSQSQHV